MRLPSLLTAAVLPTVVLFVSSAVPAFAQTPSGDAFPNKSIIIYVADFDIEATNAPATALVPNRTVGSAAQVPAPPTAGAAPSDGASPATAHGSDAQASDGVKSTPARTDTEAAPSARQEAPKGDVPQDNSPRAQAARLVDLTATALVQTLEKAGYTARRLRSSASRPESGVVIRGVFAQVDPNAGLRRMVIGGITTDPKMVLFVGIGNLAKPEQTLYQVVKPAPTGNIGPVISVSVYAPAARYELELDPSAQQLTATAESISQDLTRVLNANAVALEQ